MLEMMTYVACLEANLKRNISILRPIALHNIGNLSALKYLHWLVSRRGAIKLHNKNCITSNK